MKLFYKQINGRFLLDRIDEGGGDTLTVVLSSALSGRLTVGGASAKMAGGRATVLLTSVNNGTLSPKVFTEGAVHALESIEKRGDSVFPSGLSALETYGIRNRLLDLEERTARLEASVAELFSKIPDNTVL